MQQAGITICGGIDIDPACRHPFETNVGARFHRMDAKDLTPEFILPMFPRGAPKILAGCAPCQPFSSYARRTEKDRWKLLSKFGELVEQVRPDVVTMENVPGLARYPIFARYVKILERSGYDCWHSVIECAAYGIPQTRKRLVLLASRLGPIAMLPPTHAPGSHVTVMDTIGSLERIKAGGTSDSDRLHRSSTLSEKNMERIKCSVPGGTWKGWNPKLRAACHIRETGKTYRNVYGRMEWNSLGPTITTQFNGFGNGRFGHPEQHRAISLREGALLQTFPPDYSFVPEGGEIEINTVARMIGNAVPVKLGEAIGESIAAHLELATEGRGCNSS